MYKFLLKMIAVVWFILCIVAVFTKADVYSFGDSVVMVILGIIPIAVIGTIKVKKIINRLKAKRIENENIEIEKQNIQNLQAGLPVLNIPSLYFGETKLHFYEPATLVNSENKMIGFLNQSVSKTRRNISKISDDFDSFSTNSSGSSKAVYGDIKNSYHGQIAITTKSIIFINPEKGFEVKIDDIALLQSYSDGVSIQSRENAFSILTDQPSYFIAIINYIRNNKI